MFCPECGYRNEDNCKFCRHCGSSLDRGGTRKLDILDNRYLIISVISSGGMGCIYKAEDMRLGGIVAAKKLVDSSETQEEKQYMAKRFREEAQILFQLHHSGLPKVSDYFSAPDPETGEASHFLIMTYVDGIDLQDIISKQGGPLPLNAAISYFTQMLEILSYLHTQNPPIIYRDLKPSNIMVQDAGSIPMDDTTDPGKIFLVDFGIARRMSTDRKGTIIGTPGYASPDQYQGNLSVKSDIYSMGVIMHYLLTGIDPQESSGIPFFFKPVRDVTPEIPESLASMIESMLQPDPARRPDSARSIISYLEKISAGSDLKSKTPGVSRPVTPDSIRESQKHAKISIEKASWQCTDTLKGLSGEVYDAVFSPDGDFIVSAFEENIIGVWDVKTGSPIKSLSGHDGPVRCMAFSSDGKMIASGSDDETVIIWSFPGGEILGTLEGHNAGCLTVSFSFDGKMLAAGAHDRNVYLWDVKEKSLIGAFDRHYSAVNSVSFSPQNYLIISGSSDTTIRLWSANSGQLHTFNRHDREVRGVAFSNNGKIIASCGDDKLICIWSMENYSIISSLEGHKNAALSVMFSPDGKKLLTGSADKTLRIWDVYHEKCDTVLRGHEGKVFSAVFSPDGKKIVSASSDKTIKLWELK